MQNMLSERKRREERERGKERERKTIEIEMNMNMKTSFFEDKDADVRMIIKSCSPRLRHVSRTHGVDLDLPFDMT